MAKKVQRFLSIGRNDKVVPFFSFRPKEKSPFGQNDKVGLFCNTNNYPFVISTIGEIPEQKAK